MKLLFIAAVVGLAGHAFARPWQGNSETSVRVIYESICQDNKMVRVGRSFTTTIKNCSDKGLICEENVIYQMENGIIRATCKDKAE